MDLSHKNVIYVGGFGGIGFASCECFLRQGIGNLVILDVSCDGEKLEKLRLAATTNTITTTTIVTFIKVDLTVANDIENGFEEAFKQLGRFDVVVNGSGIMNENTIERTIEINLLGVIRGSLAALRFMDQSKGGSGGVIANVSSLVALDTYGAYAVYAASKYAVNGFTRALADPFYYERTKVRFITICPSTTETPMLEALRREPVTTFTHRPPLPESLQNNQTAEQCGKNLVEAIKKASNGTIWILSSGNLIEYKYPNISQVLNLI